MTDADRRKTYEDLLRRYLPALKRLARSYTGEVVEQRIIANESASGGDSVMKWMVPIRSGSSGGTPFTAFRLCQEKSVNSLPTPVAGFKIAVT